MKPSRNQKYNQTTVQMPPLMVPIDQESVLTRSVRLTEDGHRKRPLLVMENDGLGHVAPPEGTDLLAGLIRQFVALEVLPGAVILQGTAVRLSAGVNPVAEVLMTLVTLHVPVLVCRESLDKLNLESRIEGARAVAQREIAEQILKADQIIWL